MTGLWRLDVYNPGSVEDPLACSLQGTMLLESRKGEDRGSVLLLLALSFIICFCCAPAPVPSQPGTGWRCPTYERDLAAQRAEHALLRGPWHRASQSLCTITALIWGSSHSTLALISEGLRLTGVQWVKIPNVFQTNPLIWEQLEKLQQDSDFLFFINSILGRKTCWYVEWKVGYKPTRNSRYFKSPPQWKGCSPVLISIAIFLRLNKYFTKENKSASLAWLLWPYDIDRSTEIWSLLG